MKKFIHVGKGAIVRTDAVIGMTMCPLVEHRVIIDLVSGKCIAVNCNSEAEAMATMELVVFEAESAEGQWRAERS